MRMGWSLLIELNLPDDSKNISPNLISPSNIIIDSVTIAALICGALIIIIMLFDDFYGLRASLRIFFQSAIAYLFIFISGESLLQLGNLLGDGPIFLGSLFNCLHYILYSWSYECL